MPITLEFIAERLERIQTEQTAMRADMRDIRDNMADMQADIRVLGNLYLRLERGHEQIKDILGRIDNRLAKIEVAAAPISQ